MQRRKKISSGCEAFTLLEVALAAAVLLFAIVSAFQLVVAGTRMLDFSRKQTIATQIIHAEIEQMHITDWSTMTSWVNNNANRTITLGAVDSTYDDSNANAARRFGYPELVSLQNVASGFTVNRVIAYVSGRTDMVSVTFTVSWSAKTWSGGATRAYTRQGTTYVGKNGLATTFQRS